MKRISTLAMAALSAGAFAASHNDAPLIMQDPAANITDVYAFIGNGPGGGKFLNLVMNTFPLEDPGNGVNYYNFANDVLYSFHICKADMAGGQYSGRSAINYHVTFKDTYKNFGTILSYGLGTQAGAINSTGDARQNRTQVFNVVRAMPEGSMTLNTNPLPVAPPNVGPRTTPKYYDANGNVIRGATAASELDSYTKETLYTLKDGTRAWCGQREDGFYADVAGIFDFLGIRSPGQDGFSNYNLQSINLQIPLAKIVKNGDNPIIGVYCTTSRKSYTLGGGRERWVQVGRMGNPLFNETLVALRDKDRYNIETPENDRLIFSKYAKKPELAFLANVVLGTNFQTDNRTDLVGFFIPDLLKVDTSTAAVPLSGQAAFNRLSLFGNDVVDSPFQGKKVPGGWPNGRRLGDDVVDIALTAIASGPDYGTIVNVGDNVDANDAKYNLVFPYTGTPFGGPKNGLHD